MEHFIALKALHIVATMILLGSALGLAIVFIRGRRAGDKSIQNRLLNRPLSFVWMLMGLCLLIMPISGWWLAHFAGWSLGQTWLLAANVLHILAVLSWLWLVMRLNRLRNGAGGNPKLTLGLAIFCVVCFIAIAGLMGAKPV